MILTFYSYKGGVGRTMALANVAQWYCDQGLNVVMVDWDLEAPGLESFFFAEQSDIDRVRQGLGIIDLLSAYQRSFPSLQQGVLRGELTKNDSLASEVNADFARDLSELLPPLAEYLVPIKKSEEKNAGRASSLWMIPAGWRFGPRFKEYAETVQSFNWSGFYSNYRGEEFFDWFAAELKKFADVILIDSRTGVTEMGGVCTRQLADIVVTFVAPNAQNIDGTRTMGASFVREELRAIRGRELNVVMVPTRVDISETELMNKFESGFREKLYEFIPPVYQNYGAEFWKLIIPYVKDYAYGEKLAIGVQGTNKFLEEAYKRLAVHLALLAPPQSELRVKMSAEIRKEFGRLTPYVSVVVTHERLLERAVGLSKQLEERGISIWPDIPDTKFLNAGSREFSTSLDQSRFLIIVGDESGGVANPAILKLWRYARQQGIWICPVTTNSEFRIVDSRENFQLPEWVRLVQFYQMDKDVDALSRRLQVPTSAPRVPALAPNPPANYVARRELQERVKSLLLRKQGVNGESQDTEAVIVCISGPPGSGKTALTAALCSDETIVDEYYDGILWVTLGRKPDLNNEISKLSASFDAQPRPGMTDRQASLSRLLKDRRCLIVLDDVWDFAHVEPFLEGGLGCGRLIITRDIDVGYKFKTATQISMPIMTDEEALGVLGRRLKLDGTEAGLLFKLAERLAPWPIALDLANTEIRKRVDQGTAMAEAIMSINQSITRRDLTTIEFWGVALSDSDLSELDQTTKTRVKMIALAQESGSVAIGTACAIWQAELSECEKFVQKLVARGLTYYDPRTKDLFIPSSVRSQLINEMTNEERDAAIAEISFCRLSHSQQPIGRSILLRLIRIPDSAHRSETTELFPLNELSDTQKIVVRELVAQKVVKLTAQAGEEFVGLVNEKLADCWDRYRKWIDEDRRFLFWRTQVRNALVDQQQLSEEHLTEAKFWEPRLIDDLSVQERDWIRKSAERRISLNESVLRVEESPKRSSLEPDWTSTSTVGLVIFMIAVFLIAILSFF